MPLEPTWQEIISEAIESRLLELHTAIPGKVVSYDASTQTAEVTPVVQRAEPREDGGNTLTPLPSIPNVPVQWPRGGGYALHFPLKAGDHVLLVFSEAAIGHWRASGELAPPGDLRRHSLGYPVAIPGIAPESTPIDGASSSEARLILGPGGAIAVGDAAGVAAAQAVMVVDAFLIALAAGSTAAAGAAVTVGPGGAAAAFTAFVGAFQATLISSSKLKAQFP
jgi:hypothetical protein